MADHNKPTVADNYTDVLSFIDARLKDQAAGFDPAKTAPTNVATNTLRWSSAASKWQLWNGTAWVDLAASYAISITGSAATLTTGRTIALSVGATGTATVFDGSANISIPVTALDASKLTGRVPNASAPVATIIGTGDLTGGGDLTADRTIDLTASAKAILVAAGSLDAMTRTSAQTTIGKYFKSGAPPNISAIDSSGNSDNVALTISNDGNNSASAVIQFHRVGNYGAFFGLDTDNQWCVGGRSMGAVSYRVWHAGHFDPVDKLNTTALMPTIASQGAGGVGTYALMRREDPGTGTVGEGATVAGGHLRFTNASGDVVGAWGPGAWRLMGASFLGQATVGSPSKISLYLRYA